MAAGDFLPSQSTAFSLVADRPLRVCLDLRYRF
jgi:hypothetical protein